MNEIISGMIQQSASKVAKAIIELQKSKISSSTRTLMTKRREMAEHGDNRQRINYAEICKTIKKNAREDIRKNNQDIIRETIMASRA